MVEFLIDVGGVVAFTLAVRYVLVKMWKSKWEVR